MLVKGRKMRVTVTNLAGNTSGNNDDLRALESGLELVGLEALDLYDAALEHAHFELLAECVPRWRSRCGSHQQQHQVRRGCRRG